MPTPGVFPRRANGRDLLLFQSPRLWPHWPYLPVVRHGGADGSRECGVLFDARGRLGVHGFSATVFRQNLFLLPRTDAALLAGPKYVYDLIDELANDGWVVG